ncbi:hypothetical protein JL721_5568 [Aureococcus anophagefferens]|nr:hypothetical protein JL721_5568 [Aureococcus anophagefferens]
MPDVDDAAPPRRKALATIGGDRAWYSLTRHQGGPSAEDETAALLELSGIVHTCRHDDRSLKIFRERVAIAIRGRATALVITEKMARLDERRRESPPTTPPQGVEPRGPGRAAAHRGHDFILDSFDDRGVDVLGARDDRGRTALMLAATYGRLGVVKKLRQLARAEDAARAAGTGPTSATCAAARRSCTASSGTASTCWRRSWARVRADQRSPDAAGLNPLKAAVKNGRNEAATVLLRHGAWVREDTAEPWAQDVYRFAVEKGLCDVVRECRGAKLLSYSRYDGKGDVLDMDLGSAVGSPLLHAIRRRRHDVVDQLLRPYRGGATATGLPALMHAASLGYVKVVLALCDPLNRSGVAEDIDADLAEHATRRTALHLAAMCEIEQPKTIRSLCVHGKAEVSAKDKYGHTPLHLASDRKNVSIIRALLDHNADVDARDINGNTPLHSAARVGATGAVMVLLQSGSHVDTANKWGDTALHISLMRYHTKDQKLKLSTLGWLDEDQAYGETSLREKLSGFGHGTMRRLGDLAHGDLPAAFGGGRERRLSSVVEVADVAKKGNFEGVVEQLLNGNADLGRRNKHDLPAFSVPLQEHYFNIKKDDLEACSTRPRPDHHGEAPYHLLFGNKRVQKAVGTVWLRKCFAGSVLMLASFASSAEFARGLRDAFAEDGFAARTAARKPAKGPHPFDGEALGFDQVTNADDLFHFLETTFAAALDAPAPERWSGDGQESIEWRSRANLCDVPDRAEGMVAFCFREPSKPKGRRHWTAAAFGAAAGRCRAAPTAPARPTTTAPCPRRRSGATRGGAAASSAAGAQPRAHVRDVPGGRPRWTSSAAANRSDVLASLAANDWVDAATRAVDLRLVVYNANANLFCALHFVVEFPPEGGGIPTSSRVARVWPYLATGAGGGGGGGGDGAGDGGVVLWLEVACFVFACFFFVQEFDQAVKEKYSYLTNPGTSSTSSSSCSWRPTR